MPAYGAKAMLKGRMTASRFEHMWQIEWYDANGDLALMTTRPTPRFLFRQVCFL